MCNNSCKNSIKIVLQHIHVTISWKNPNLGFISGFGLKLHHGHPEKNMPGLIPVRVLFLEEERIYLFK